jgi:phage terminase large subunit
VQAFGKEIRFVDCLQAGKPISWFAQQMDIFKDTYKIAYGEHFAPHDIAVRDLVFGVTREKSARELGITFTKVEKTKDLNDSIEATRRMIARCWFDNTRPGAIRGIGGLESYHRKWDSLRECYFEKPEHDWASNYADGFRQVAQAWHDRLALKTRRSTAPVVADTNFQIF